MGEHLAAGNTAVALLANTLATGAALAALILTLGPVSGAHFNPVVSLAEAIQGKLKWRETISYIIVQVAGAFIGVATAHVMFGRALYSLAENRRHGLALAFSELIATSGLITVISCGTRQNPTRLPYAIASYIMAAYWFTASTSFANPAVTLARTVSNSFAGIRPIDAPGFILAQLSGMMVAVLFTRWLVPASKSPDQLTEVLNIVLKEDRPLRRNGRLTSTIDEK